MATAHLESGRDCADLRRQQLDQVGKVLSDGTVDAAVFAADCNLGVGESVHSRLGLGGDAWALASKPPQEKWTWPVPSKEDGQQQRFDRVYVRAREATAGAVSYTHLTLPTICSV